MYKNRTGGRSHRSKAINNGVMIGVVCAAVVVFLGLIVLTGRAQGAAQANASGASVQNLPSGITSDGFPYIGAANAPVTIIAYEDYGCPHCRDFTLQTEPQIEQNYVATGKVKIVAHYFGFNTATQTVAVGAMCAAQQGKYWQFNNLLFANQSVLTLSVLSAFAQQAGLNVSDFNQCVQSPANLAKVQESTNQAYAAGLQGTPTFFINGQKVEGALPYDQFSTIINQALAQAH
jgi:protein-disulfide isomerase